MLLNIIERILKRTLTVGDCLRYWGVNDSGYGLIFYNGKRHRVHRIILENKLGRPIREGFEACHTRDCKYKNCVNENHLYEGTHIDNILDRTDKRNKRLNES